MCTGTGTGSGAAVDAATGFFESGGGWVVDAAPLSDVADLAGTPTYVYSAARLAANLERLRAAFADLPHTICYSLKANGNLAVGRRLGELGCGADLVSVGELHRAELMGIPAERRVFAGVGKRADEIEAALIAGVRLFNVESEPELEAIAAIAGRLGRVAPVAIRVNPDVDARTHPYISTGMREHKFGVPFDAARQLYARAAADPHLDPAGVQMHIGSQLVDPTPIAEAAAQLIAFADALRADGLPIRDLDIGGGLGVRYHDEEPRGPEALAALLRPLLAGRDYHLLLEPGRFLLADAGALLTRVVYVKTTDERRFVVVDAAMNDLIRPALYSAYHQIVPVQRRDGAEAPADIVGPVCESSDFLARGRPLPPVAAGDLLLVLTAGAYGFTMASNYNARPRAAEVLVDGAPAAARIVRRRETLADLVAQEINLPA